MFNMKNSLILMTCLLQTALVAPQLISFKDGKVGVNFLGYHAEAGLGGGQNGGGLLGGLHASAGTPWGQNAAAGLGGNVNGRASGVLYAGAQATRDVGAGAVLGGDTSRGGFSGSEAYANGKVNSRTRIIVPANKQNIHDESVEPQYPPQPATAMKNVDVVQKIRPKKYYASHSYNLANRADYSFDDGDALSTNKPTADKSFIATKIVNKATFGTRLSSDSVTTPLRKEPVGQSLYKHDNNEFNSTPAATLSPAISSSVSLNHSLNGNIAEGVNANYPSGVIITRDKTKLRAHRRNRHHKRINGNRQRQRSKTIIKVVEQQQEPAAAAEYRHTHYTKELLPTEVQQVYNQQQQPVRRQLIAPGPPAAQAQAHAQTTDPQDLPAPACDPVQQKCKTVHKEIRTDVVQNALQIPIGILQSLQQTLGIHGSH